MVRIKLALDTYRLLAVTTNNMCVQEAEPSVSWTRKTIIQIHKNKEKFH